MSDLRKKIIDSLGSNEDGSVNFLIPLLRWRKKRKNKFITPSLAVLTQLEFSPEDAKKSWKHIVEHKGKLETKLGHAISLMTTVCYYFSDAKKYQNPAYHRIKTALGNKKITFS